MTEQPTTQDGRVRRRLTNTDRVLDALRELGAEQEADLRPQTIATRAGVSLRSLNRFFPDQEALLLAALRREVDRSADRYSIPDAGVGSLDERIDTYVRNRLLLHHDMAPLAFVMKDQRPSMVNLRAELLARRARLQAMVRAQFAPELDQMTPEERDRAAVTIHVLCQRESLDALLHEQGLAADEVRSLLGDSIRAILRRGLSAGSAAPGAA